MLRTKHLITAVFCLLPLVIPVAPATASVILNTLQGYQTNEPGWSGSLDGLFSGSGGNTEQILLQAGGRVQWQNERNRYRIQFSGGYQENDRIETARNAVVHLRHSRSLSGPWSTVSFIQVQHNPFQRLRSRWLVGFGPRYDLKRDEKGVLAIGATPMLEVERLDHEDGHLMRGRMSVFVHMSSQLSKTTKLDALVFWQPLFSDVSAARSVGNLTLTVDLSGEVDIKIGGAVEDNARAAVGVDRTDWSTFTGLSVAF